MKQIKKVLVLGSGALKIGEAGEFDYSGSQAIKAFKEEGIKTILVNPNIATIQTSKLLADRVYFLPVSPYFVEKIIEKEKPDAIALSFGGQTALNCGLRLYEKGVLEKHKVQVLGTPVKAIDLTEDRKKFADHLHKIGIPTPQSKSAKTLKQAQEIAKVLGFPLMVRAGFALGGQGSGVAKNLGELEQIVKKALAFVPQVLIEQYLHHFKEIEYEVVRDKFDNCITVCNMENMDPLGIHTGESIVVAPSQTLTNDEYHALREASIKIVRSLGIVGECNVQYALNPKPKKGELDFYVIEVNARLSRSSALASKATGYPLAYVAAKLALEKNLTEIKNKVTQVTQACFEPALDYIVVKIPRWDIEKFIRADNKIGSSMKSVGEVMGIGRTFEEAFQKAIRMLDLDLEGVDSDVFHEEDYKNHIERPTPKRMFALAKALEHGSTVEKLYNQTGIDPWFLYRVEEIVKQAKEVKKNKTITKEKLLKLKQLGFSDKRVGQLIGKLGLEVRSLRKKMNVVPSVFQIDTLAGEFPAKTNYLYTTYNGNHNDVAPLKKEGVIVLGSGPYRIGSSVEFDWTSVNTVLSLKKHKRKSITINCNPETVSTDYDISDRLYFEELSFERIADIYEFENPQGIIISVGGQTPNNRAHSLKKYGITILGTDPDNIDRAENRSKFSKLCDQLLIKQPDWNMFAKLPEAITFCEKIGYPVLIRPSYVLSGAAMNICYNEEELERFLNRAVIVSPEYPITISKFVENAKEIEFDAVAKNGEVKASIISEHIENAGVHSGDATIVLPAKKVYIETQKQIEKIGSALAKSLLITGPFNIQFLAKDNDVSVIEINLRSSRTFPFISKVTGVNFIELATAAIFGEIDKTEIPSIPFTAVKVPQFSFSRLTGADPVLRVEMASTGEVACFGNDEDEAFLKGEISVGTKIPQKGIYITLGGDENKAKFLNASQMCTKLDLPIYCSAKTAEFLASNGVKTKRLYKIHEKKSPNVLDYFQKGKIDLAINITDRNVIRDIDDDYILRRAAVDTNIPLFTDIKKAELFISAIVQKKPADLLVKAWDEYV